MSGPHAVTPAAVADWARTACVLIEQLARLRPLRAETHRIEEVME